MITNPPALKRLFALLLILTWLSMVVTACAGSEAETQELPIIHTQLLVRAPESALPLDKPITVRSRIEAKDGVSHVELYAVQSPSSTDNREILIRADEAQFDQTTFTASQTFTPRERGRYVIKVVGYNRFGQSDESDFIGFEVQ